MAKQYDSDGHEIPQAEYEICARCAWDRDDERLPEKCWNGEPHLWELTSWQDAQDPRDEEEAAFNKAASRSTAQKSVITKI